MWTVASRARAPSKKFRRYGLALCNSLSRRSRRRAPRAPRRCLFCTMAALAIRLSSGSSSHASRLAALTHSSRIRSRYVHSRKEVPYPIEGGLGTFLPPPALKMLAVDYQQGLLDRLNQETKGEHHFKAW